MGQESSRETFEYDNGEECEWRCNCKQSGPKLGQIIIFYFIDFTYFTQVIRLRYISSLPDWPIPDYYLDLKSTKLVINFEQLDDCHLKVAMSQIEIQHLKVLFV